MNKYTLYNIEKWLGARYILIRNKYEQARTTPIRRSDSELVDRVACPGERIGLCAR